MVGLTCLAEARSDSEEGKISLLEADAQIWSQVTILS